MKGITMPLKLPRIPGGITTAVVLVALLVLGFAVWRVAGDRARHQAATEIRDAQLERENAIAAADTTRVIYADSVQLVARRALQLEQERDRADRALQWERRVTSTLLVAIRELRDSADAPVTVDTAGVRHASWSVRQEPWTADVDVSLPAPPDSARLRLAVALDPVGVTVRAGCGQATAGSGVRPATVAVEGPTWASLQLHDVVASPEVCSPLPRRVGVLERIRIAAPYAAVAFVAGGITALYLTR